jgi:hypothetical protein
LALIEMNVIRLRVLRTTLSIGLAACIRLAGDHSAFPWSSVPNFSSSARITASRGSRILTIVLPISAAVRTVRFIKPTPAIDLIFGAYDHFIGIAIYGDKALRLLDLLD